MAKISFYELLGISDKATPTEIQTAFEKACSALEVYPDSEERRNRLIFLKHARDSLLEPRKRALNDRDGKQVLNPPVLAKKNVSGWWRLWVAGVAAGYLLAWWMAKPVATPAASASPTEVDQLAPRPLSRMSTPSRKPQDVAEIAPAPDPAVPSIDDHPAPSGAPQSKTDTRNARLREMAANKVAMFDMREEAYRIANTGGVRLQDIQFDSDEKKSASVAWAMPRLERKERYCSIRVARAYGQDRLRAGEPISEFDSTRYKAILAHELSHCVDWYETGLMGWRSFGTGLLLRPDLTPADVVGRWREEFADLYAIYLLKLSYGEALAKDASQLLAFERKFSGAPAYRHSWIPMERGNPLSINSPADARAIIARYWMH